MKTTPLLRHTSLLLLFTFTAATAIGCGGPAVKPPRLQVTSMKFTAAGLTGAKLSVAFSVHNVNAQPLTVESFRYNLTLNEHHLGSGYYATRFELGGRADQQIVSVFDLDWSSLPASVQSLLQQDHVKARVDGKFFIAGGTTLNYSCEADVSLQR